jgi:hypothetical protein
MTATDSTNDKGLEDNLREAKDLSRALWMLMAGLIECYPHSIGKNELMALYALADEIQDRTREADRQWHEEPQR